MRQEPAGQFKWIGHVVDHFSKFHFLFPSISKEANDVAKELAKIFALFGMPRILQSDNGESLNALT